MLKSKAVQTAINNLSIKGCIIFLFLILVFSTSACNSVKGTSITLATTTSVNDSGLLDELKPVFEKETGIILKILAQGTGQAIKTAENGDADVLFVHDKQSEEKFVADGFGIRRIELMYNYFVVAGPSDDPAGIANIGENNAVDVFKKISDKQLPFVSRGDDSGTHKKELAIWKAAGLNPSGGWYISAGKGMGAVLTMADEKKAYALTDKATYLSMKDKLGLKILLEGAEDLKNQYTIIAVNPDKHKNNNAVGAAKFIKWMTSDKALKLIDTYGDAKYGDKLFKVNYVSSPQK